MEMHTVAYLIGIFLGIGIGFLNGYTSGFKKGSLTNNEQVLNEDSK